MHAGPVGRRHATHMQRTCTHVVIARGGGVGLSLATNRSPTCTHLGYRIIPHPNAASLCMGSMLLPKDRRRSLALCVAQAYHASPAHKPSVRIPYASPRPESCTCPGIAQVEVTGVDGELKRVAQAALKTRPNFAYTIGEVRQDVQRVFNTGWFRECVPDAVDTRDGVKLIINVRACSLLNLKSSRAGALNENCDGSHVIAAPSHW